MTARNGKSVPAANGKKGQPLHLSGFKGRSNVTKEKADYVILIEGDKDLSRKIAKCTCGKCIRGRLSAESSVCKENRKGRCAILCNGA